MSASVISSTQFWHSRSGPFAAFSQEKRGAERPVTGDLGERNDNHTGYVLGADGSWTTQVSDKVISRVQFQGMRQRQDSQPRYFHGSTHVFGPGQTIDPTPDRVYGGEDKSYATGPTASRGYKTAADYAYMRAVPHEITEPHQGQLFAAVHEVAPRSQVENPSGAANQIASTEPMDVKGVAGWVRTDDLGRQLNLGEDHDF